MTQVAGGTASGKSTVCEKIMETLRLIDQENVDRQVQLNFVMIIIKIKMVMMVPQVVMMMMMMMSRWWWWCPRWFTFHKTPSTGNWRERTGFNPFFRWGWKQATSHLISVVVKHWLQNDKTLAGPARTRECTTGITPTPSTTPLWRDVSGHWNHQQDTINKVCYLKPW